MTDKFIYSSGDLYLTMGTGSYFGGDIRKSMVFSLEYILKRDVDDWLYNNTICNIDDDYNILREFNGTQEIKRMYKISQL